MMNKCGSARAAVVHWGTDAPLEMAVAPVQLKRGRKTLKQALSIPPTLGGTNLAGALSRAHELTPPPAQDEQTVYYILTDGIEPVTPAIAAAIANLPAGSVHMLLVDRSGGCDPNMEAAWRGCAFGSFTRLRTFDTEAMSHQLADIAATTLGLEMPHATTSTTTERQAA
jgi:hypothetical protein